jgi:hypothetical protein
LKRVILDEGVAIEVAQRLPGHDVTNVHEQGWDSIQNGRLLALIEKAGFDVFITCDKNLEHQNSMRLRPFAVLLLSTNHWPTMEPNLHRIAPTLETAQPGEVTRVDVGRFVPSRRKSFRPPQL